MSYTSVVVPAWARPGGVAERVHITQGGHATTTTVIIQSVSGRGCVSVMGSRERFYPATLVTDGTGAQYYHKHSPTTHTILRKKRVPE